MDVVDANTTMDGLFEQWRTALGADHLAYRNHAYRVFNFSVALARAGGEDVEKLAVAAAFHDIGIWLDHTFDYLTPSERRGADYLAGAGRGEWAEGVRQIIEQHHKVRPWRGAEEGLVNAFRQADWLDVCLFALPTQLERSFLRAVLLRFPRAGFHRMLVSLAAGWTRRHPLNPLPVIRW